VHLNFHINKTPASNEAVAEEINRLKDVKKVNDYFIGNSIIIKLWSIAIILSFLNYEESGLAIVIIYFVAALSFSMSVKHNREDERFFKAVSLLSYLKCFFLPHNAFLNKISLNRDLMMLTPVMKDENRSEHELIIKMVKEDFLTKSYIENLDRLPLKAEVAMIKKRSKKLEEESLAERKEADAVSDQLKDELAYDELTSYTRLKNQQITN